MAQDRAAESALAMPPENSEPSPRPAITYRDITKQFSILGWTAFGGPAAHIGLYQKYLVERYNWISPNVFVELFALGQCLPGPTSTQVSFALGTVFKGISGGLLSGALFQYPGALMMTLAGVVAANTLTDPPGYLKAIIAGLSAVSVAMIASAAKGLLFKMSNTKLLAILTTFVAGAATYCNPPWLFPSLIVGSGVVTIISNYVNKEQAAQRTISHSAPLPTSTGTANKSDLTTPLLQTQHDGVRSLGVGMRTGALLALLWLVVLLGVSVYVPTLNYDHRKMPSLLDLLNLFYRTGSLVYGGGQVVLPMLLGDLVKYDCVKGRVPECMEDTENSWMSAEQFYAGLGLVQAMPGPLFNLSGYLGAVFAARYGFNVILGAITAWIGLFGPGIILTFAALPYWTAVRQFELYRFALPGMNAAGVGLILSSVFRMTTQVHFLSPFPTATLVIGLIGFTAVDTLKIFEPLVVLVGALLGLGAFYTRLA